MSNVTVQEALKAAIEVIEQAIPDKRGEFEEQQKLYENYPNLAYKYDYLKVEADEMQQALDNCKAAIAEIEKCEPVINLNILKYTEHGVIPDDFKGQASGYRAGWNDCLSSIQYMFSQPIEKCEPELYMAKNLHNKSYATSHSEAEARLFLLQSSLKVDGIESEVISLCRCDTSPQPREWVEITDEQAYKCISDNATTSQLDLVRDVEAKCKQLNTKG